MMAWNIFSLICSLQFVRMIFSEAIICPRGFSDTAQMVPYNKQMCLQFVSAEKYWDDARDYCWERNGRLVKIENEEMNNFIIKTLNEMTQWRNNGVWIGLHDRNVRNQWQWVTIDKNTMDSLGKWSYWGSRHPQGYLNSLRNCVRMVRRSGWKWHETACHMMQWKYRFICEYEPYVPAIAAGARIQSSTNSSISRPRVSAADLLQSQKGSQDANIPGVRRSSPFTRGRQANNFENQKSMDSDSSSAAGSSDFQVSGLTLETEVDKTMSSYWRYFLVIGILCACLVLAFSFMLALLLVRLWRVRRRDSVQTIDALAKNRIWRVMNTRDTDMYGSHQRVFPKAVWENEYILDDSRTLYGEKYGLPPWDRAGLLKIPYQENKRNSNAEATGLLMNEKNAEEHIYETIEDVRKEMAALKAREDAQEESRKEA